MTDFYNSQDYQSALATTDPNAVLTHGQPERDLGSTFEPLALFGLLLFVAFGFKW
ncbi:MAG: hypothetical protein AAGF01_04660 [Cyanobacteria bacterium P01_G01_bin.38]